MKKLRWILLGLYLLLVAGFLVGYFVDGASEHGIPILIAATVGTQWLFLAIRGKPQMLLPVQPRQLRLPSIVAGFMAALLVASLSMALCELAYLDDSDALMTVVLILNLGGWALWSFLFYSYCSRLDYLAAIRRMVLWLIGGSLLQLMATVPSHFIVVRRPGCLVGIGTAMGIMGGLLVMGWAFGPGIILLFMYETRRRMSGHCMECGYNLTGNVSGRCPECGEVVPDARGGQP